MTSTSIAQERVAVLQQSINEVLLHTGKALKAAQSHGSRDVEAIRSRLSSRMTETMDRYQNAVDDIEREVLDAKAILLRDLKAVRARIEASKQASQQAAATKPDQAKVPVANQPAPPTQTPVSAPVQGPAGAKAAQQQQRQPQSQIHAPGQRNGSQQSPASRPVAPVPNMGVGVTQPTTKTSSPLLNKKTPSASTPTPVPKPSPHMNGAGKPGAKASPASRAAVPAPVPTPKPVPTAAMTPPVSSTPATSTPAPAAPAAPAPIPMMDASQGNENLNLPSTTSGGGTLNFTDIAFTVAQGNDSGNQPNDSGQQDTSQSMSINVPPSNPEVIDIDSLFDTASASGGEKPEEQSGQQSGAPPAPMDSDNTSRPANQAQESSTTLDDMYDLGGGTNESMDLDFAFDQSGGGGGDSYIDDLFFGTGDGSLGELDESGLG